MITFKQFISEIDHDDSSYSKDASHAIMLDRPVDSSWAPLLTVDGYELFWKMAGREFRVVMKDQKSNNAIIRLGLAVKTAKVPGGTLTGVITDSLSSHKDIRGKGLPLKLYASLIENGQVLFSSDMQTAGSRHLWEQLVASDIGEPFVFASESAARWYINRYKSEYRGANVLLTGSLDRMDDEAYASSETRWVIIPHFMVNDLKQQAIQL